MLWKATVGRIEEGKLDYLQVIQKELPTLPVEDFIYPGGNQIPISCKVRSPLTSGLYSTNEQMETSVRVYAAGDVRQTPLRQ